MRDWLIVAGGVRRAGGQDRANLELVRYLAFSGGRIVTVVANRADAEVFSFPNTVVRLVPSPLGSNLVGEALMRMQARRVHRQLPPDVLVLANGGNFSEASANWVHCVHAAWEPSDVGVPVWRRVLARAKKASARKREREALTGVQLVVANSQKTARDLSAFLQIPAERVHVIYFGADRPTASRRDSERTYGIGFMGALGWDRNKGLDIALQAFARARKSLDARYRLIVAGHGAIRLWRKEAERLGMLDRVDFRGFVEEPGSLFRSIDLLISPSQYEAYGLAVHEALVEGVPVLVSSTAGVAERIAHVPGFVVGSREVQDWAQQLVELASDLEQARAHARRLGDELGRRSWEQMAKELVLTAESRLTTRDSEQLQSFLA